MMDIHNWPLPDKEKVFDYLRWNSYRSERYKLFYVATPKVACTSLKWWFADLEGYTQVLRKIIDSAEMDPDLVIHDSFHKVAPSVAGLSPEALLEPLTSDAYFRFAVVRNPYKRIFSAWQSKLLLREPLQVVPYLNCGFFNQPIEKASDIAAAFEGFLEHLAAKEAPNFLDVHWTPQATLLRPDLIGYSKLVKIENVKELSAALSMRLGPQFADPFATRRTNESLIPYLPQFVTEQSSELIRSLYAEDFETFGYGKQLPEAKETFSADQLDLALKAIKIIRGRHQRLGEMSAQLAEKDAQFAEKDAQLAEKDAQLAEKDAQLAEKDAQLAEKEKQIIELERQLLEKDRRLTLYAGSEAGLLRAGRPIMIYQMGKVGSTSVYETLRSLMGVPIYPVHLLNDFDETEEMLRRDVSVGLEASLWVVNNDRSRRRLLDAFPKEEWNVISLVRDPLAIQVSRFFQSLGEDILARKRIEDGTMDLSELIDIFINKWPHPPPLDWFEDRLKPVFDIDVYSRPFPHEKGYDIIDKGRFSLLLIRLEDLDRCAGQAFEEFLGIHGLKLKKGNVATSKWYDKIYKEFKAKIIFTDAFIENMYYSRGARHFYTQAELDAFIAKWTRRAGA